MSAAVPRCPGSVIEACTASPEETRALGRALAGALRPGDVLLVSGDLGAGKTVLAQGVAAGLGVRDAVTSPTFTLVRPLTCGPEAGDPTGPGPVRTMLHADLYRLEHRHEVVDLALDELVEEEAVAVIEWGEAATSLVGRDALGICLEPPPDDRSTAATPASAAAAVVSAPTPPITDGGDVAGDVRLVRVTVPPRWTARAGTLAHALAPWTTGPLHADRSAPGDLSPC